MTSLQPRDSLGQFASRECAGTYRLLAALRGSGEPEAFRPNHTTVPAPRCPHGHFTRWALKHCRGCSK